jgi:hypothetical protein
VPVYLAGRAALSGDVALGPITSENLPADQSSPPQANLGLDAACVYTATLRLDQNADGQVRGSAAPSSWHIRLASRS